MSTNWRVRDADAEERLEKKEAEIATITAQLTSAKEEIARLTQLAETRLFGLEELGKVAIATEAALTAAKETIERQSKALDTLRSECASRIRKATAAESLLSAESKETERLRELLAVVFHYNYTPYDDVPYEVRQSEFYPQGGSTKKLREAVPAALQERQGEE